MRLPEHTADGRKLHSWTVKYRPRLSMAWRVCQVWAPTKAEALECVKQKKGRLAKHIECDNKEPEAQ